MYRVGGTLIASENKRLMYNLSFLKNGVAVVTYRMPQSKSITIDITADVGGRYETEIEHGMSHFLEHMAFKGTHTRSAKEIAEAFDNIGGRFNACTDSEVTRYYSTVLPEDMETAVDILSDIMQNSVFAQEEIDKECSVICQEIARSQDDPNDVAYQMLMNSAFQNQQLGATILGTPESIGKFTTNDFNNYVNKHYLSSKIVISAAGDIDHKRLHDHAESMFAQIRMADGIEASRAKYIGGYNEVVKPLEQSVVYLGFEDESYRNMEHSYRSDLLSIILGGGLSSRLFQEIREVRALAYSVGATRASYDDVGLFCLYAGTSHDKVGEVVASMREEANKICNTITDYELQRAKKQLKMSMVLAEERPSYKAFTVASDYLTFKREVTIDEILKIIDDAQISDLHNIATKIFAGTPTTSIVGAKKQNLKM